MNIWKVTTITLASLFAACIAMRAVPSASADKQPQMTSALGDLNRAVKHLNQATADKGGHRVKALELTKAAIAEVQAGINFDNTH